MHFPVLCDASHQDHIWPYSPSRYGAYLINYIVPRFISILETHTGYIHVRLEISQPRCQYIYQTEYRTYQPQIHDDVIKWKHFPRYWLFVRGIHRSPVNSPHKGQWRGALMFSLICAWINGWINNHEAGNLRRHRANYDVTVIYRGVYLPTIGTESDWGGRVSPTSSKKTVRASSTVTLRDICNTVKPLT